MNIKILYVFTVSTSTTLLLLGDILLGINLQETEFKPLIMIGVILGTAIFNMLFWSWVFPPFNSKEKSPSDLLKNKGMES